MQSNNRKPIGWMIAVGIVLLVIQCIAVFGTTRAGYWPSVWEPGSSGKIFAGNIISAAAYFLIGIAGAVLLCFGIRGKVKNTEQGDTPKEERAREGLDAWDPSVDGEPKHKPDGDTILIVILAIAAAALACFLLLRNANSETPSAAATEEPFSYTDVSMQDTPDSTCFSEIGYDSPTQILVVRFRDSGSVYEYFDVRKSVWLSFRGADSLGEYYNEHIKGSYEYLLVEKDGKPAA